MEGWSSPDSLIILTKQHDDEGSIRFCTYIQRGSKSFAFDRGVTCWEDYFCMMESSCSDELEGGGADMRLRDTLKYICAYVWGR